MTPIDASVPLPVDPRPFHIPEGRQWALNVSGGRSSGMLARRVLDAYGGKLPPHVVACFANTGKEREQTLDFVHEMEQRWGLPITWLEYRFRADRPGGQGDRRRHGWQVVDHATASRDGEPFAGMVRQARMLPSIHRRICTVRLKIEPIHRWVTDTMGVPLRRQGNVLGIRADETRRVRDALFRGCQTYYPLVLEGIDQAAVRGFWARQPFDLQLPLEDYSNCDLCHLKGRARLMRLIRREPERADWWIRQEREHRERTGSPMTFGGVAVADGWFRRLRDQALSQPDLPLAADDDTGGVDCFCGD